MLHGLRPTSPGDARSVGSFQAVKWLSHILARKRAAVFHGPLDSLPSANTTRWNHMIRFQCVGIGGLGAKPSSLCSSARPAGAVPPEPAQPRLAASASIKTVFPVAPNGRSKGRQARGSKGRSPWARTCSETRRGFVYMAIVPLIHLFTTCARLLWVALGCTRLLLGCFGLLWVAHACF